MFLFHLERTTSLVADRDKLIYALQFKKVRRTLSTIGKNGFATGPLFQKEVS